MLSKGDWITATFGFQVFSVIEVAKHVQNTVTQWGKWDLISLKLEKKIVILSL